MNIFLSDTVAGAVLMCLARVPVAALVQERNIAGGTIVEATIVIE